MVVNGNQRIGLYPSLDEALDRRRRSGHPVGSVYLRIRDGEPLARLVKSPELYPVQEKFPGKDTNGEVEWTN